MGISACSIALLLILLGSLFSHTGKDSKFGVDSGNTLTVVIKKRERQERPGKTPDNEAVRPSSQEQIVSAQTAEPPLVIAPVVSPEPQAAPQPPQDWHAIATETVESDGNAFFREEASRASMWRRTHSVMFQPTEEKLVLEEESLLSDIPYNQYSHVIGLGLNIGSCFIGIPISGVPVENRTAAISIFVCT